MAGGRRGYPEEERLPWLEEAPRGAPRRGGRRLLPVMVLAVVLLAAGFVALRWWPAGGEAGGGPGLIRAPVGPYKVRPAEPGGMDVEGEGSSAYVASEGGDPRSAIDLSAVPEAPVSRTAPVAPETPVATSAVDPLPAVPGAAAIQLGAFSSEAKANAAWKALSQRFGFLGALTPVILPAKAGDATVYRLRAPAGVNARAMCGRLKVAGETCLVIP